MLKSWSMNIARENRLAVSNLTKSCDGMLFGSRINIEDPSHNTERTSPSYTMTSVGWRLRMTLITHFDVSGQSLSVYT